ncbi:hypothetical protein Leryth_008648 [Lithospermum erythrorhizon]|nr:hypothetical protein Leryth_008648 [Lithospermum erythrorhizon]
MQPTKSNGMLNLFPKQKPQTFHFFSKPATSLPSSQNQIIPNSTTSNTFSELIMQENIENAKTIITKYDIDGPNRENFSSIFQENRNGAKTFISCVKELNASHSPELELEFHLILTSNKEHLKPESISSHSSSQSITNFSSSDDEIDRISTDDESESVTATAMLNLKQIADCMISAGYSKECARKFMIIRKSVTSEMFYNLGIESYSSTKIKKMNSNDLKDHIKEVVMQQNKKVSTSSLKYLLGDEYIAKLDRKVKSYAANYEEIAWSKAITCLPQDPTAEMSPDRVKGRFKKFNEDLEEALRKQMAWVIPDRKLREEIKLSIGRKLVPAYQNFYNSQMKKFGPEKNLQRSVRLSPDDLGNCLSNLFHGVSVSGSSPSSSRN